MKWTDIKFAHLALILISTIFLSQNTCLYSQSSVRFQIGTSVPISKFGLYQINEYKSNPKLGLSGSISYSYMFTESNFGLFAGFDFLYNGLNNDFKEAIEKWDDVLNAEKPNFHAYYNLPISTGLLFNYMLNNALTITINSGLAFNILRIADFDSELYKAKTELSYNLGFKAGIGVVIQERFLATIDYFGLGNHDVNGSASIGILGRNEEINETLNIHLLTLSMGIVF